METYTLKIREKFINSIKNKQKVHEYRLNNPERKVIKIGDYLVLLSTTNQEHFVKVRVCNTEHFKNWEEALTLYWKQDFNGIYNTFNEAVEECYKFYDKKEVDEYGIVVFDIEPIENIPLKNSSLLLDTNAFIYRESVINASEETSQLFRLFEKLKIVKYVHPTLKEEIEKNKNKVSRDALLIKLKAYTEIVPDNKQSIFFDTCMSKFGLDENSKIDNKLLKEVYFGNVDYLLTDDKEMLRKASSLYIRGSVLSTTELLRKIEHDYPEFIDYKILQVKKESFSSCDINDPFFTSLREDYKGKNGHMFDDWFNKKRLKNEPVYLYRESGIIKGFLYIKVEESGEEDYKDINPIFSKKKRLKVGTFKIESTGKRVGERFIKIIFENAVKQNVDEIYVTLFEDKRSEVKILYELLAGWGFSKWGNNSNGELVLVKEMRKYNPDKNPKFNFPLMHPDAKFFFLPIEPSYHTELFPDSILTTEDITFYTNKEESAHRYALEKVYVSGVQPCYVKAKPGDVLLIYRNGDRLPKKYSSVVSGLAILEEVIYPTSLEEYLAICKNITVFKKDELVRFYNSNKYRTIIKLIDFTTFQKKVTLNFLQEHKIVGDFFGPRPFQELTSDQFRDIININKEEQ